MTRAFLAHPVGTGGICWDGGKPYNVVGQLKEDPKGALWGRATSRSCLYPTHCWWWNCCWLQAAMGLFLGALGWLWGCYEAAMGHTHSSVGLTYPHTELVVNLLHSPPLPF